MIGLRIAAQIMATADCPSCNNLQPKDGAKSQRSTSVRLLHNGANEGCQSCRLVLDGLKTLVELEEDYEVELNCDEVQHTLRVLVWTGDRMTRNPRKSRFQSSVAPLRFEFYTRPGRPSPWAVIGARPVLASESASESCFQQIRVWIKKCTENHADCPHPALTALPSRLLDVGSAESQMVRLVETRDREGTYITLSHCWGGHQPLTTTKSTKRDRLDGIEWASLPKTFQDAVTITRRLQVQYIWIDSLCIIQDDGDDWEVEAANMGAIYEASLLTISASTASNPDHGIFSHRIEANKAGVFDCDGDT